MTYSSLSARLMRKNLSQTKSGTTAALDVRDRRLLQCRTPDLAPNSMRLDRLKHEAQLGTGV
ncbi:hypothetical protein, partial [Thiorhodococcus mannitoliphagus]|uniref:hypothetical protein n=1 Tax=Thiorhodococcus mannitoliphagus TaxID=329406 RepID=UPI00197FF3DF